MARLASTHSPDRRRREVPDDVASLNGAAQAMRRFGSG